MQVVYAHVHNAVLDDEHKDLETYPCRTDTLAYDEMMASALCGMSSYTHFRNIGDRSNKGKNIERNEDVRLVNTPIHEYDGILVGLVGERFEAECEMGWRTLQEDTDELGESIQCYITMHYKNKVNNASEPVLLTFPHKQKRIMIDMFIKRLCIPVTLLLDDAVRRVEQKKFRDRKPYVVASGLGSGVWAKDSGMSGDDIDYLNLAAWVECMCNSKYNGIPIIEFRRYVGAADMQGTYRVGDPEKSTRHIDNVFRRLYTHIEQYKKEHSGVLMKLITLTPNALDHYERISRDTNKPHSIPHDLRYTHVWKISWDVEQDGRKVLNHRYFVYRSWTWRTDWSFARSFLNIYNSHMSARSDHKNLNHTNSDLWKKLCAWYNVITLMYLPYLDVDAKLQSSIALLVSMFAWDSNSYVGNEFWRGHKHLDSSGDPVAVCCSDIGITMNPDFNKYLRAEFANGKLFENAVPPELVNLKQQVLDEYALMYDSSGDCLNKPNRVIDNSTYAAFIEQLRKDKIARENNLYNQILQDLNAEAIYNNKTKNAYKEWQVTYKAWQDEISRIYDNNTKIKNNQKQFLRDTLKQRQANVLKQNATRATRRQNAYQNNPNI